MHCLGRVLKNQIKEIENKIVSHQLINQEFEKKVNTLEDKLKSLATERPDYI